MTSAQGIDISHWQPVATADRLAAYDFVFCKATEGSDVTDPNFAANWAVIKAAGKHRGGYHELRPGAVQPVAAQAANFVRAVRAGGLEPGDMLAVSVSDYTVTDADAKGFLDAVKDATGARNPVICYTDLSAGANLPSCTGYPLWTAWPASAAPASVAPWDSWRIWQWGETGVDTDAYNGSPADMAAWIASYASPSPVPTTVEFDMAQFPVLKEGDSDKPGSFWFVRRMQALVALAGSLNNLPAAAGITDDGSFGHADDAAVRAVQGHYGIAVDGVCGAQTWGVLLTGSPG